MQSKFRVLALLKLQSEFSPNASKFRVRNQIRSKTLCSVSTKTITTRAVQINLFSQESNRPIICKLATFNIQHNRAITNTWWDQAFALDTNIIWSHVQETYVKPSVDSDWDGFPTADSEPRNTRDRVFPLSHAKARSSETDDGDDGNGGKDGDAIAVGVDGGAAVLPISSNLRKCHNFPRTLLL